MKFETYLTVVKSISRISLVWETLDISFYLFHFILYFPWYYTVFCGFKRNPIHEHLFVIICHLLCLSRFWFLIWSNLFGGYFDFFFSSFFGSSDLQLAIALQQQEFEEQEPQRNLQQEQQPQRNLQQPAVTGSSRLVTGPQVSSIKFVHMLAI